LGSNVGAVAPGSRVQPASWASTALGAAASASAVGPASVGDEGVDGDDDDELHAIAIMGRTTKRLNERTAVV
jgi:hypothetical protein